MPFRRKHRNSLFGSSRSADKENAHDGMQETMLPLPPVSPRLFRCHSDNTQQTRCDINPNAVSSLKHSAQPNSVLSTKERMANLLELNATLVKEVSFLRNSQHSMSVDVESLKEELQAASLAAHGLRTDKQQLAQEINELKAAHSGMKETLEAEKNNAEGRLECVNLVIDNLQSMNGVLAEEAARLREDADHYAMERHALVADLDKMTDEKSLLEDIADSIRAGEEEFRKQMQQVLLQAEMEKEALLEEKQALMEENVKYQIGSDELKKEVEKLEAQKAGLISEQQILIQDKENIGGELFTATSKLQEVIDLLASERHTSVSAQDAFDDEKRQMRAENEKLERALLDLQSHQHKASQQFDAERQSLECESRELSLYCTMLRKEKDGFKQDIDSCREMIQELQQELVLSREAVLKAEAKAKASSETASNLERELQDTAKKALYLEGEIVSNAKASECKLDAAHTALIEEKSLVKAKTDQVTRYREKLDEAVNEVSTLEAMLTAEKEKQKHLDAHIQTVKGDLLVAEDAAIQAQTKAKAMEKDAEILIEKRSREASQKIGALESKLTAMAERQSDLEDHIRFKEAAFKAAVLAENEAKGKLKGLLETMQSRGGSIEGYFKALKESMEEMQRSATRGNESIASLKAEFASLMDIQVTINNGSKSRRRRGRSRAKACHQAM